MEPVVPADEITGGLCVTAFGYTGDYERVAALEFQADHNHHSIRTDGFSLDARQARALALALLAAAEPPAHSEHNGQGFLQLTVKCGFDGYEAEEF